MKILWALQANLFVVEYEKLVEANPTKGQKQETYLTREVREANTIPHQALKVFYANNSNLS